MSILNALILGIVEGVTEFLPISSTGHMILVSNILGLSPTDFVKSFEIIIQLGAILSIVVLYWKQLLTKWEVVKRIAVAFIPTAIIGLVLYKLIKSFLLGNAAVVVWALALGGLALVLFERWHHEPEDATDDITSITYKQAALVGIFQSIAVVPGVSRAAATIVGGLLLGIKRTTIVEFSFLLAVPTMLAASVLDVWNSASSFVGSDITVLLVGFSASFVVALFVVRWLLQFVKTHSFTPFGVYRIILALIVLLVIV